MNAKKAVSRNSKDENGGNFEKSLERLENIVSEMESGSLSLEEMIKHFEEGQLLAKFCSQKLDEVQKKVEMLVKRGEEVCAEPFDQEDINCENSDDDGKDL